MSRVRELHREAMKRASEADAKARQGDAAFARIVYMEACKLEAEAAEQVSVSIESEPTRSILYLSAASLAVDADDQKYAIRLIADGLRGFPPQHIEDELKDLYEKVNYSSHLRVRGVELEEKDMQLSLQGKDIGLGFVPYALFDKRLKNIDQIIKRTYQRKIKLPFQDMRKKNSVTPFTTVLSVPRAASFAISIRLLRQVDEKNNLPLPFYGSNAEDILDDVVVGLELVNENKEDELKKMIGDNSYFTHFLWHAREIAPDGEKVALVGLTTKKRKVAMQRPRHSFTVSPARRVNRFSELQSDNFETEGFLDYASKKESRVGLSTKEGRELFIVVAGGMEDLVRSNFGKQVIVKGKIIGDEITPEDIMTVDES